MPNIKAVVAPTVAPVVSVTPCMVKPNGLPPFEGLLKTVGVVVLGLARKFVSGTEIIVRPEEELPVKLFVPT